jgi:WD40 repeat protein
MAGVVDPKAEAEARARHAEVSSAFLRCQGLSGGAREVVLAGLDARLRREVEELLAAETADDALSDQRIEGRDPLVPWIATAAESEEPLPERIAGFRVLRRLGAGGMGVVYEAEQEAPRRRVALKLVRPGLAHGERLRRFRLEAEALGRLQHPGIAQIFDFGTADLGQGEQPFFVMELVEGRPLLVHAAEARLDRRARLALVAELCDAVQHAHERGVVHRDLKPDNVLVDTAGRAKVLDFGVARVRAGAVPLTTIHTAQGQIVGTLTHMAPEQLEGDPDAVGPAADVYALGVIAFELLTGCLPHEVAGLSITAAVRRITEVEAPRLGRLDHALRGDVETIVAKALEPYPARRYVTAAAFASDLRRHLAHEPIAARPAGPLTRGLKFTRRHPGLVGGTTAAILALGIGLAFAWDFALDARARRCEAEAASYRHALTSVSGTLAHPAGEVERNLLLEAPENLRGWEWHYLRARTADPTTLLAPAPLGTLLPFVRCATIDGMPLLACALAADPERKHSRLEVYDLERERVVYSLDLSAGRSVLGLGLSAAGELTWIESNGTETVARRIVLPSGEETLTRRLEGTGFSLSDDGHRLSSKRSPRDPANLTDLDTARTHEPSPQKNEVYLPPIAHEADLTLNVVATGEELLRLPRASGKLFASAGRLVTHGENLSLRVWDTGARPVREILSAKSDFHVDCCDLQGRALAILDWSGMLTEYLLDGSGAVTELARPGSGIAYWCPGGEHLVLQIHSQIHSSGLRALDTTLPRDNVVTRHASYAYDIAVNPSLGLVATAGWDGYASQPGGLRLLDLDSGAEVLRLGNDSWIGQWVSWLPRTGGFVVTGLVRMEGGVGAGTVRRIDVVRGEVVWEVGQGRVQGLACSPDGTSVAISRNYGELALLDAADGREHWRLFTTVGNELERSLAWSPDGALLAGVDRRGPSVVLIDPRAGAEVRRWPFPPNHDLSTLAFSFDGRLLATASQEGEVRMWNPRTGEAVGTPLPHDESLLVMAFHPDGTRLVTGGRSGIVHVWSLETHEELLRLTGHTAYVHALTWIDEGRTLLSASGDGTVRRWSMRTVRELAAARKEYDRLASALQPRVDAFLAGDPAPEETAAWLETCSASPRERQVARHLVARARLSR